MNKKAGRIIRDYLGCTLGAAVFVTGINIIVSPLGLYNGGFVGIGQLVRYVLATFAHFEPEGVDIAGIVYFLLNAPLFILAFKSMSHDFFLKTVYSVLLTTVLLSLVPIPAHSFTDDMLTACIIGGLCSGVGAGIILRSGASGGGQDILGVYFAKKIPGYSVGKITIMVNIFVYGCCALLFDIEIVVYSLIYTGIMSVVIDRVHVQNINTAVLIVTKKPGVEAYLIKEIKRGVTSWKGKGGYTDADMTVAMTAVSKYEIPRLRKKMAEFDKDAFIIVNEGEGIYGNFEKRMGT